MIIASSPLPEGERTTLSDSVGSSTKVVSGADRLLVGEMKLLEEIGVNVGLGVWLEVGFSDLACEGLTLVVAMDSVGRAVQIETPSETRPFTSSTAEKTNS
jgi:hypothetical protein